MSVTTRPTTQPANLSVVVRASPPAELTAVTDLFEHSMLFRHVVIAAARFLSDRFEFSILQDRFGNIWVQKDKHMIIPVGGRRVLVNSLDFEQSLEWLSRIHSQIRLLSRNRISANVPYAIGVLCIYEGVTPANLPASLIPVYLQNGPQSSSLRLKPVNAWMVFRSWFVDGLKTSYIIGQSDISRLARVCYGSDGKNKDWVNIAHMYTHARNHSLLCGITLPEFVKRELKNYGYQKKPIHLLRKHNIDMKMFPRRPDAPIDDEEGLYAVTISESNAPAA